MVACGQHVAEARGLLRTLSYGLDAVPDIHDLLTDALALLTEAPNGDRERERLRKADYRARKKAETEMSHGTRRDTRGTHADPEVEGVVGVEDEVEEVVVVEVEDVEAGGEAVAAEVVTDVDTVYAHWRSYHPRAAPKLNGKARERRRIKDALASGLSVEDCCAAVDGYHRSPFHLGDNDRKQKYLGLDLIFRDAAHVTKGMEMADDPLVDSSLSQRSVRTLRVMNDFAGGSR
jgi:hypothetical protein